MAAATANTDEETQAQVVPDERQSRTRHGTRRRITYRHSVIVRLTHWINAAGIVFLLMSGLQIFNAHPALYWGSASNFEQPLLSLHAGVNSDQTPVGVAEVFGHNFPTTGVLGLSEYNGRLVERGFPAWITIPPQEDLATGRVWHFFFVWIFVVNGLIYLGYTLLTRHFWRDLLPTREQLRHIGASLLDHLRLRFPRGEEATRYNVLQKLTYLAVILVLLPLVVATGLAMSPGIDAALPWLPQLFGGRQSARTFHFVAAWLIVLFTLVHVLALILSRPWNGLRSMVTGRFVVKT
jgi:thiosulfate reductase cytochrome b subunit